MQVQRIQNNNNYSTAFQSKFANTQHIKDAFAVAKYDEGSKFIRAVEKLLADGKSDVIDVTAKQRGGSGTYYQMDLNVNNEIKESIKHENGITDGQTIQKSFDAKDLIIKYAGLEDYVAAEKPASVVKKQLAALEKKIFS